MMLLNDFRKEFEDKFKNSARWGAFEFIAENLLLRNWPISIGETGCVRMKDNWLGDGQSTRVWDWLIEKTLGKGFSVDIKEENCKVAASLCPNIDLICGDSITFLSTHKERVQSLDLLFLDSYDYHPPFCFSELHHAGELAASYHHLPGGCLVAVDDCHSKYTGKHTYVRKFFDDLDLPPSYEGYIIIWQKPSRE